MSKASRKRIRQTTENDDTLQDSTAFKNEMSEYEMKRLQNVKENADFLASLGINQIKTTVEAAKKPRDTLKTDGRFRKKKSPPPPRRASMRLRRVDPTGEPLPPRPPSPEPQPEHPRKPPGPLTMSEQLQNCDAEDHQSLFKKIKDISDYKKPKSVKNSSLSSFMEEFEKLTIKPEGVAKVVPDRIFGLAIHPSESQILVAAGGKWGAVGLWNVERDREFTSDGVVTYTPHSRPVPCLKFPSFAPHKLFSCSYDGTLRCGDLNKEVFDEVYSVPEDEDNLLKCFDFLSHQTMVVSQQDGAVAIVDTRTKGAEAEHIYPLHMKSLRTVSVHPVEKHMFLTCSPDSTIRLWDDRMLKQKSNKEITVLHHAKTVSSAYFSPVTGNYILSTSSDDTVRIFDSSKLTKDIKEIHRINHNNHVGRWLTPFRAAWHPSREDMFVVGSMNRPRRIELYNSNSGRMLHTYSGDNLESVCSLSVIHPTLNILIGGNSSGRLHAFMKH